MGPIRARPAPPPDEVVARVRELGRAGLILQAYQAAIRHAPLRDWTGPEGRFLAANIAGEVGAPRLARALIRVGRRETPGDAMLLVRRIDDLLGEGRFLSALELLEAKEGQVVATDAERAHLRSIRGLVLARFRDFEQAHRCLEEASRIHDDRPWLAVSRAFVLMSEDRYEEAAREARAALAAHPTLIRAIGLLAHLLQIRGLDDEAADLLEEAVGRLESGSLAFRLAVIRSEQEDFDRLERALGRYEELSPLLEKDGRRKLAAFRADVAHARGDFRAAAELGETSGNPFHLAVAERLKGPPLPGKRVILPVGFVQQHHLTCGPATLSAITRYWGQPAEHLEIAEEICYAGITSQAERAWAESHGWAVKEFTVSWDAARGLLDRGIPFTLSTRDGVAGHLQAVIGYDPLRGTFFLRDPNYRHHVEAIAQPLLEEQAACGPRGMALVPSARAHLLEGLELPDAPLYDHFFVLESSLRRFDREQALLELRFLESTAPEHRLALLARFALSAFDGDSAARHAAMDRWIQRFPGDVARRVARLESLEALGRGDEACAEVAELCAGEDADPVLYLCQGRLLGRDVRNCERALRWIRRAVRMRPEEPRAYQTLGEVAYRVHGAGRALGYYRLASCLSDRDEDMATAYFRCAREAGRPEEALAFLEERRRRLGHRSAGPAATLALALLEMGRDVRAFEVFESARELHPEDGQLMLMVAQALQERGREEAARLLLDRARGKCPEASHQTARARIALMRGDHKGAREAYGQVILQDPLSMEGHAAVARLVCREEGPSSALRYCAGITARTPHHVGLRKLEIDWVRNYRPDQLESKARALVEISPGDVEARLEWSAALARQCREAEAIQQAEVALAIAPRSPQALTLLGRLLASVDRDDDARRMLRRALQISPDLPEAIQALVLTVAETQNERRSFLEEIAGALRILPTSGEGLRALVHFGKEAWSPDELQAFIEEFLASRPDLPTAWSASVHQAVAHGEVSEALSAAEKAVGRFPLSPESWMDLAQARNAAGNPEGEIEALGRALRIRPGWRYAVRMLAAATLRAGRREEALALLRQEFPTELPDPDHDLEVASILWWADFREEAVDRLRRFLRMIPRSEPGWSTLSAWAGELGQGPAAEKLAQEIAEERPEDPGAWQGLAIVLRDSRQYPKGLRAIWKALDLDPLNVESHDLHVEILASAGLFDQALVACRPAAWGESPPLPLRGRRAWVHWQRGDRRDAVSQMRDLLWRNRAYVWGWIQLAGWCLALEDREGYTGASERWVWLDPHNAGASFHHGRALLWEGEREQAKESLRRAVRLAPRFKEAVSLLFDSEMEDGCLDAAESVLRAAEGAGPEPVTLARRVRLACARADTAAAVKSFRALCGRTDMDWPTFASAVEGMLAAHLEPPVVSALDGALGAPAPSPWIPLAWINLTLPGPSDFHRCLEGLRKMPGSSEAWDIGFSQFLERLFRLQARSHFDRFVAENRRKLLARNHTWLAVVSSLVRWGRYPAAREWAQDWESREGLWPEAYWSVSLAFRGNGDHATAARVTRHAVDGLHLKHESLQAWALFDKALSGEKMEEKALAEIGGSGLEPCNAFLVELARALGAVSGGSGEVPREGFARARRFLRSAEKRHPGFRSDGILRQARLQAGHKVAAARGSWLAALWRRWRTSGRAG